MTGNNPPKEKFAPILHESGCRRCPYVSKGRLAFFRGRTTFMAYVPMVLKEQRG